VAVRCCAAWTARTRTTARSVKLAREDREKRAKVAAEVAEKKAAAEKEAAEKLEAKAAKENAVAVPPAEAKAAPAKTTAKVAQKA
jgi:hypothetical protein